MQDEANSMQQNVGKSAKNGTGRTSRNIGTGKRWSGGPES